MMDAIELPTHQPAMAWSTRTSWAVILLIAFGVTALNAFKPLTIDDGAYQQYATQIAQHPLDPYGFSILWTQWPEPANDLLAPPVLPSWWAAGIRLFGPSIFLCKLWLFPWMLAFVGSMFVLLRRFAPVVAVPVTIFTACSPLFLPAVNYMLDIPALGLGLTGLCVAMSGVDRRSIGRTLLAGVIFGLALQTKYTVLSLPATAAVYGILHRRYRLALLPGIVAVGVFAAWEFFVWHRYGYSHFILHARGADPLTGTDSRLRLLSSVVTQMGIVGGPVAVLTAIGLGVRPLGLLLGGALSALPLLEVLHDGHVKPVQVIGAGCCAVLVAGVIQCVRRLRRGPTPRDDSFLLWALGIEFGAFMAISPFSATRRLMGMTIFLILIAARLCANRPPLQLRRQLSWAVAFAAVCGGWIFFVDTVDARAEKTAVDDLLPLIEANRTAGAKTYYLGFWGFDYYCRKAGLQPLVPDNTLIHPGDLVVFPEGIGRPQVIFHPAEMSQVKLIVKDDALHCATIPAFYDGQLAMKHRTGPRLQVFLLKAITTFVPKTAYSDDYIVRWALTRPTPMNPLAVGAVLNAARSAEPGVARGVLAQIDAGGPPALIAASDDVDPRSRQWAVAMLGRCARSAEVTDALRARLSDTDTGIRAEAAAILDAAVPISSSKKRSP